MLLPDILPVAYHPPGNTSRTIFQLFEHPHPSPTHPFSDQVLFVAVFIWEDSVKKMIQSQVHTPGLGPGAPDHLSLPGQGRRVWLCSQRGGSQPASCLQGPAPTQGPAPPKSGCRPTALQGTPTSPWWTSWRPPISSKPTPRASSNPPPLTDASPHISPSPDSPLFPTSPPPRS